MTDTPPDKFFTARVTERVQLSDALWMMRVDPGGEFRFTAGQYATLGVKDNDRLIERPYSIVSAPHEALLEFVIELVPEGELTPRLFTLGVGDAMYLRRAAKGRFTLDTRSGHTRHMLLCTVTGIAPYVSYIRSLAKAWRDGQFKGEHALFVLQGASHPSDLAYSRELQQVAAEMPWLTYVPTVSRPWDDATWTGETGRVDEMIRLYADRWGLTAGNATAYLCGHPDMISHGKAILARNRWPKESLKEESYFTTAATGDA